MQLISRISPGCKLLNHKLCGYPSDLPDPPVLLRHRNKLSGIYPGFLHSYQSLIAVYLLCDRIDLGLVKHEKAVIFKGLQKLFTDTFLILLLLLHLIVKQKRTVPAPALCHIHGALRV